MKTYRILILEDDLSALSVVMNRLFHVEQGLGVEKNFDFAVTVLSEYTQVEELINPRPDVYDIILLDRDCRACGSFHVLDFKKFDPDKIIAISTYPEYNQTARDLGVKISSQKDYDKLEEWGNDVKDKIVCMLNL